MPIKPENRGLYPPNWKEIRDSIVAREGGRCKWCKAQDGAKGYRAPHPPRPFVPETRDSVLLQVERNGGKVITIVLTVAHLDHDPRNNDPANLAALCQQCHNNYDAPHRAANAAKTRADKKRQEAKANGQATLPGVD